MQEQPYHVINIIV